MTIRDLHDNIRVVRCYSPAALATVAGAVGKIIDRQGWGGVEFIISYGLTGASGAALPVVIKDGAATNALASVADTYLLGTEALAGIAAGTARSSDVSKNVVKRVGYKGVNRYVQAKVGVVSAGLVTAANIISIDAILHSPQVAPTSNP